MFSRLPDVLIQVIISYSDAIQFRNGKYIDRIDKNDFRYNLLRNIPPKERNVSGDYFVKLYFKQYFVKQYFYLSSIAFEDIYFVYLIVFVVNENGNLTCKNYDERFMESSNTSHNV